MLLLLSCWIIAGITAEDPPTRHYRVKNSSLCLQVVKSPPPPPYQLDAWSFEKHGIVVNKNISPNYKDKVYYNPNNHSLCINNLNEKDSGIYTFSVIDSHFKTSAETHRLIVEETVPSPVIRMSPLHSNLSAELCNITVNCSIQDHWVCSVCDINRCITSQRSLFGKFNITIFPDNRSIVCSANNHVSKSNVSESIAAMCVGISNPEPEDEATPKLLIAISVFIAVCVFLCVYAVWVTKRLVPTECNHNQTSTAQIIQSQPVEAQPNSVPRLSTSSSSQAEACYENVDAALPCQPSSPRENLGSMQSQKVDTIYSVLQTHNVTSPQGKSDSSKDTKGHKTIQEAPTSQYVTLDEAEQPAQIDTVYSVLQKPKKS